MMKKIRVLGEEWTIEYCTPETRSALDDCDGYTDNSVRKIVVDSLETVEEKDCKEDLDSYKKRVLRHELIHAYLEESGLSASAGWPLNEEMVDWFAAQAPKIYKTFRELGLVEEYIID